MPARRAILIAGTLLLMTSLLWAHDLFLKLDTYFLEPHARVRIPVLNGTFAKSEGFSVVLGYPAEIVPLANPYAIARGATLRLRCLVDGRPVGNQMVLWAGEARGQTLTQRSTRTDSSGVAEVMLDAAGRWYVKFVHMVRATQRGVDYESKWATLTFQVR